MSITESEYYDSGNEDDPTGSEVCELARDNSRGPSASAGNGGFAYFVTVRPRGGVRPGSHLEKLVINYTREICANGYYIIVAEEEDEERNLHVACFTDKPYQRFNFIRGYLRNALFSFDDDEKRNFSQYDRNKKNGCVVTMTSLGCIENYIDSTYGAKRGDSYQLLAEYLPDAECTEVLKNFLPAVDGLKRKHQISVWYLEQEKKYHELNLPKPATMYTVSAMLERRMFKDRDMEIISNLKVYREKCHALVCFINHSPDHVR
jgi:hypothetical protein